MRTAKTHRKFAIYSNFLDVILEGEEEIQQGETRKDVLLRINKELEETAAAMRKEAESFRGQIISEAKAEARQPTPVPDNWVIQKENPVLNLESTLGLIKTAPDLETLKSFKVIAGSPGNEELYKAYNSRVKQLMNGTKEI